MNAANRLNDLLTKVKMTPGKTAISVFEELFEVKGATKVCSKLRLCKSQINKLKNDKAHGTLITFLESFFSDEELCKDFTVTFNQKNNHIPSLHTAGIYMPKEQVDDKELTELADLLIKMEDKIKKADVSSEAKKYLFEYVYEIKEGIDDMHLGGVESLHDKVTKATGIYVVHNEAFVNSNLTDDVNKIYSKTTKILNEAQIWGGLIGYVGGKFLSN